MKYVASVSFGKDSLAMLLRLIQENKPLDEVIFYNTGMEFDCIYKLRDRVKKILVNKNIKFTELHPPEPFLYSMFEREIKYRNKDGYHYGYSWCGEGCRWHTSIKVRTINKYKKSLDDVVIDYIGIATDETDRYAKANKENKLYPLVEWWGMSEQDCLEYCKSLGFYWVENTDTGEIDLYSILDRVSCWCCANKNLKELYNIYIYLPNYWEKLKILQSKTPRPMKPSGTVFELEKRFKQGVIYVRRKQCGQNS